MAEVGAIGVTTVKRKIELLAPAGSPDALRAAVENGADAVYLGGLLFNARQQAGNFSMEQLEEGIRFCHVRGVKVYLTMNTILSDTEIAEALNFVAEVYSYGIDAVIVQDIGLAAKLKQYLPELPLHASTQMTIYNAEGAKALEALGFSRVITARELSVSELRELKSKTKLDVEVFGHGALCICYSGQCLMSSMIGARSGNRGKCAQPCRLPYSLVCSNGNLQGKVPGRYLLSPKDIYSLRQLEALISAGVSSLKIEGRMKSPEYVATVVRIYRKYLDRVGSGHAVEEKDVKDLHQIFNRGGFSDAYLRGKKGISMMSCEKPKNHGVFLGSIVSRSRDRDTVEIWLDEEISIGDGLEVWSDGDESVGTTVSYLRVDGKMVKTAKEGSLATVGDIRGQLEKGQWVYKTSDKKLNEQAAESYKGGITRKVPIQGTVELSEGKKLCIEIYDEDGNHTMAESLLCAETALKSGLTEERLVSQLTKTGQTPFAFSQLKVNISPGLSIPVSEMNDTRRRVLEQLEIIRGRRGLDDRATEGLPTEHEQGDEQDFVKQDKQWIQDELPSGISIFFHRLRKDVKLYELGAKRVYVPAEAVLEPETGEMIRRCHQNGTEVYFWIPSVTKGSWDKLVRRITEDEGWKGADGVLAGNLGSVSLLGEGVQVMGDQGLNIFNIESLKTAAVLGFRGVTLSPELTLRQAVLIASKSVKPGFDIEAAVYGQLPVMVSEYCPVGSLEGDLDEDHKCSIACTKADYRLRDRKGAEFPIICDRISCRSTILNSEPLFVPDVSVKLSESGVNLLRIYVYDESDEEIKLLTGLFKEYARDADKAGRLYDTHVSRIKRSGYTNGHYYRGV